MSFTLTYLERFRIKDETAGLTEPSGLTLAKDGFWNLTESNLRNLEKIEELFLHTIEQQKQIKALEKENEELSDEVRKLREEMEAIKTMLKQ